MVKNPPVMLETWVWSLGQEDPLEKRMGTHFSVLAWRIPWTEEPGGLQSIGSQSQTRTERLTLLGMEDFLAARQSGQNPSKPLPSAMAVSSLSSHWEGRPAPPTVVRNEPGMEMPPRGLIPGCRAALSMRFCAPIQSGRYTPS